MKRYPKQKLTAYGVYKEFMMFGSKMRSLEKVFLERHEAVAELEEMRKSMPWAESNSMYVEEVEVMMKAWQTI